MANGSNEAKITFLQKEVESCKKKIRESNHEKVLAINRCTEEWESKLAAQASLLQKKQDVNRLNELNTLSVEMRNQMEREIAAKVNEKNQEIKELKEIFNCDKENIARITRFQEDEKWRKIFSKSDERRKEKEYSMYAKIQRLTQEKEQLLDQVKNLQEGDYSKAQEISRMHYEHEKTISDLIQDNKQSFFKEYSKLIYTERYAKDNEHKVRILESQVDALKAERGLLEEQLKNYKDRIWGGNESRGYLMRNFTSSEVEQSRKIQNLQQKISKLEQERIQSSQNSISNGSPHPHSDSLLNDRTSSPTPSQEKNEKVKLLKRQRDDLKDIVKRIEDKCQTLENENTELKLELDDEIQARENTIKRLEELENEKETLTNENIELTEKMRDLPSEIENHFATQVANSQRECSSCLEKSIELEDQQRIIQEVETANEHIKEELSEAKDTMRGLKIRCEKLREEYQAAREQGDRLIEDREAKRLGDLSLQSDHSRLEKQIVSLKERNQRLKEGEDKLMRKLTEYQEEIDRLGKYQQKAMKDDSYIRQLEERLRK